MPVNELLLEIAKFVHHNDDMIFEEDHEDDQILEEVIHEDLCEEPARYTSRTRMLT